MKGFATVLVLAVFLPVRADGPPAAPSVRLAGSGDAVTPALAFSELQFLGGLADDGSALFVDSTEPSRFAGASGLYLATRSGLRAPVVTGDPAPGGSGFAGLGALADEAKLSHDGHRLLFHAHVADGSEGLFLYDLTQPDRTVAAITPVILMGDPAPAPPVPPNAGPPTWSSSTILAVNGRGDAAFLGSVVNGGCTPGHCTFRNGVFFKPADGPAQVIYWEAFVPGGTIYALSTLLLNEAGTVAFSAVDTTRGLGSQGDPSCGSTDPNCVSACSTNQAGSSPCAFRFAGGTLTRVVCEGDPFPDGSGAQVALSGYDAVAKKALFGLHQCFPDATSDCKSLLSLTDSGEVIQPLYAQSLRYCDGATVDAGTVTYTIPDPDGAGPQTATVITRRKAGVFGFRANGTVHVYANVGDPAPDLSAAAPSNCPCVFSTIERANAAPDGSVAFGAGWEGGMITAQRESGFGLFVDTGAGATSLLGASERAAYTSPGSMLSAERVVPPYRWSDYNSTDVEPLRVGGGGAVAFAAGNAGNFGLFWKQPGGAVQRIVQAGQALPGDSCMPSAPGTCLPTTNSYPGAGTPSISQQSGLVEYYAVNASGEAAALVNRRDRNAAYFKEEYRGLYLLRAGGLAREATSGEAVVVPAVPHGQAIDRAAASGDLWASESGELVAAASTSGGGEAVVYASATSTLDALAVTGQLVPGAVCPGGVTARLASVLGTRIAEGPGGAARVLFTGQYVCADNTTTRTGLFEATGGQLLLLESACESPFPGCSGLPFRDGLFLVGVADLHDADLPSGVTDPAGRAPAYFNTSACPASGGCTDQTANLGAIYRDACQHHTQVAVTGGPAPGGGTFASPVWRWVDRSGAALLSANVNGGDVLYRVSIAPDLAGCGPPAVTFQRLLGDGDVIGGGTVNVGGLGWGTGPASFFFSGIVNYATTGLQGDLEFANGSIRQVSDGAGKLPGFGAPPGVRATASNHAVLATNASGELVVTVDVQRPGPYPGCVPFDECNFGHKAIYVRSSRRSSAPPVRAPSAPEHWCLVAGPGLPVQDGSIQRLRDQNFTTAVHLDDQGRVAFRTATTFDEGAWLLWTRAGDPPWPVAYPDATTQVSCQQSGGAHLTFGAQTSAGGSAALTADWVLPQQVLDANPDADLTATSVDLLVPPGTWSIGTRVYDDVCMAYDEVQVTVLNDSPPVFTAPAQVTLECGTALPEPAVSDCGSVVITGNGPAVASVGVLDVTWTAVDQGSLSATFHQQVTGVDTLAPAIFAPHDTSVVYGDTPVLGTPGVHDLCDPAPVVTNDLPATLLCGTTLVINWCARDAAGHQACAPQSLEVVAPAGGCPAPDAGADADAGSDAGLPDSGVTDAGVDAGADAGEDAGAPDAGTIADAGTTPPAHKSDGCSCTSATPSTLGWPALLLALGWPRRKRGRGLRA